MRSPQSRSLLARSLHAARLCPVILLGSSAIAAIGASTAVAALSPGELVVADSEAFGGAGCGSSCGGLIAVNPTTGAESALSSNSMPVNASSQYMGGPYTLAFDASGDIIVGETSGLGGSCSGGCGGVVKVDPATGKQTLLSANSMTINASSQYFGQVNGVTIDRAGNIIVSDWGACVGCGKVIKVNPTTGKETLISSNSMAVNASSQFFAYPQGLTLDHSGNILIADALAFGGHGGGIVKVDPTTGKESELSANSMAVNASSQYFTGLGGLTVNAAGEILGADWGGGTCCGKIIQVDPTTGKESIFSSNSMAENAATQYFNQPVGITIDQTGKIYVADEHAFGPCTPGCGGVIEVNPSTRAETEISSNLLASNSLHPLFVDPWSVVVVPSAVGGGGSGNGGNLPAGARFRVGRIKVRVNKRRRRARFAFGVSGAVGAVTFVCRLDNKRPRPCTSPTLYRNLRRGRHVFAVRAIESMGLVQTGWATRKFRVPR